MVYFKSLINLVFAFGVVNVTYGLWMAGNVPEYNHLRKNEDTEGFQISCLGDGFQVTISKELAQRHGISDFRLIDNSCTSTENDTHLLVSSSNDECNTSNREIDHGFEYSNELLNGNDGDGCPYLGVTISCWYAFSDVQNNRRHRRQASSNFVLGKVGSVKRCKTLLGVGGYRGGVAARGHVVGAIGIIAKPEIITCPLLIGVGEPLEDDRVLTMAAVQHNGGILVKSADTVCKPLNEEGNFHTTLKLYDNSNFSQQLYDDVTKQKRIDYYEDVFYEASMLPAHENLRVILTHCYATPDSNPANKLQYAYIKKGCPIDPTVKFYPTTTTGSARFSITGFRFRGSNSHTFFSHCELLLCDRNDPSDVCQQNNDRCDRTPYAARRKRSTRNKGKEIITRNKIFQRSFGAMIEPMPMKKYQNSLIRRMSLRGHKSTRYMFVKRLGKLSLTIKVKVPKRFNGYDRNVSPVQVLTFDNDNEISVKNIATRNNIIHKIKHCYFGYTQLRARQKVLVKNGCITDAGKRLIKITSEDIIFKKHLMKKKKRAFLTCIVQVCKSKHAQCLSSCKKSRNRRSDEVQKVEPVDVSCLANLMVMTIQKKSAVQRIFHLLDPQCIATENDTHYILKTGFNECGTTFTSKNGVRYYENEVVESVDTGLTIIRRSLLKRTVRCAYNTRSVLSPVRIEVQRQTFSGSSIGRYRIEIGIYRDGNYTTKVPGGLMKVDETSNIYFEVRVANEQFGRNLTLHLDACLGFPIYRNDPKLHYTFIEDGCALDDTVVFYKTNNSSSGNVRFSIQAFKFSNDDSNIAINCYVTACHPNDKNSKCSRGCRNKEKKQK